MPLVTRYVAGVETAPIYSGPVWAGHRIAKGTRYTVCLQRTPSGVWSDKVYTLHAWKASLCLQAWKTNCAITLETRETRWGQEIVTVELAELAHV